MANFNEVFRNNHAVLPVVHIQDEEQAIRNVGIAMEEGADGVFLISMEGMGHDYINRVHSIAKEQFPSFWIGVNYLDLMDDPLQVFPNLKKDIGGAWLDDAWVNLKGKPQMEAEAIARAREDSGWDGLYFGGVAFKYRGKVSIEDLTGIAEVATKYVDVVTTSGDGTGIAPSIGKIQRLKEGVGDSPLAIASGITPDNVSNYLEIADAFLVATSLLKRGTEDFDPAKVKALVEAVRNK